MTAIQMRGKSQILIQESLSGMSGRAVGTAASAPVAMAIWRSKAPRPSLSLFGT